MPSFSFEVPGEATPLTEHALARTLTSAASRDPLLVQSGTKQLQVWETKDGYHSLLQDAFLHKGLPYELRMLALIQLKNGVDKYWRRSANNAISAPERDKIRSRVLESCITEETPQLASLEAVVAAKIARTDFPINWPSLVVDITNVLRAATSPAATPTQLSRSLTLALQVTKELSTIRVLRSKSSLQSSAPELFHVLQDAYLSRVNAWEQHITSNEPYSDAVICNMDISEHIFKILRRLVIAGYEDPHKENEIRSFWGQTCNQLQRFCTLLDQNRTTQYFTLISLHLTQLAKFHLNMASEHPVSFGLLSNTPELVRLYWSVAKSMREHQLSDTAGDDDDGSVYDSFCLRALQISRACFRMVHNSAHSFKFRSLKNKEDVQPAKDRIKDNLLTDSFVGDLFQGLLKMFFVCIASDFEEWTSEPEEWELKAEGDEEAYERSVRPCAERLFLDITLYYKDLVMEPLLRLSQEVNSASSALAKDAIFSAIGIAAPMLHNKFDFNVFLNTTLVNELSVQQEHANVLRRRVAILLAQWIRVDIDEENKPLVYQIYQHLLDKAVKENDQAVRITAGKRFHDIADEWSFKGDAFAPMAPSIINRLVDLIHELELPETKMAILHTLSTVVERMELQVGPFANQIVSLLPPLWDESGNEHLMKQAIVSLLGKLVGSLKGQCAPLHDLVIPIIHTALEPGSDIQVYLLEDSLDLLAVIVSHAQTPASPELLAVSPFVLPVLEMELETIAKGLNIIESFVLLAPTNMMQDSMRQSMLKAFSQLLTVRRSTVVDDTIRIVEMMIRVAGSLQGEPGVDLVSSDLQQAGIIDKALSCLMSNWTAKQTTGPNKKEISPDWLHETNYLTMFARIVLGNTQSFLLAVQSWANSKGMSFEDVIPSLLEEWFGHMDSVGDPTKSKAMCLALTKLLETGAPWILVKLQDLMALWTSMVIELRDDASGDKMSDCLVRDQGDIPPSSDMEVPEHIRQSNFARSDPVYCIKLPHYVRHHLLQTIENCGGQNRFQEDWVVNVDKEVVKGFGDLEIM